MTVVFSNPDAQPITGSFSATGQSEAFKPRAGVGFNIELKGTASGAVQLERSFDEGVTWVGLYAGGFQLYAWTYTAALSETAVESETNILYRLNCTALTSGTITYRASQSR